MTFSPPWRLVAGFSLFALPLGAQTVTQQGWNPKEVLAKEKYVKPPEIVERIVDGAAQQRGVHESEPGQEVLPQDGERRTADDRRRSASRTIGSAASRSTSRRTALAR